MENRKTSNTIVPIENKEETQLSTVANKTDNSSNLPDSKRVINTAESKHITQIKDETEPHDKKSKDIETKLSC